MSRGTRDLLSQRHGGSGSGAPSVVKVGSDPRGAPAPRRTSNGLLLDPPSGAGGGPNPPSNAAASNSRGGQAGPQPLSHNEAALLSELSSKVNTQKRELDNRTDNVNAIQRNFTRLSEMYQNDRTRLEELETKYAEALEELESLRAEKKLFSALQAEFRAVQEREHSSGKEHNELIDALKKELVLTSNKLQQSEEERKGLQKTLTQVGKRIQEDDALLERVGSAASGTEIAVNSLLKKAFRLQKLFAETVPGGAASTGAMSLKDGGEGISYIPERQTLSVDARLVAVSSSLMLFCEGGLTHLDRSLKAIVAGFVAEQQNSDVKSKQELDELSLVLQSRDRQVLELEEGNAALARELKATVRTYEAELAKLKQFKDAMEADGHKNQRLAETGAEERRRLIEELTALRSDNEDLERRNCKLDAQFSEVQTQLKQVKQEHSSCGPQTAQLTHANQVLVLEKDQALADLDETQAALKAVEAKIALMEQDRLRREKSWVEEREVLLKRVAATASSKDLDAQGRSELQRQNSELSSKVNQLQESISSLEKERQTLIEQTTVANGTSTRLQETVERLQGEVDTLQEKLSYFTGNQDDVADALKEKERDLENYRKELRSLQQQLIAMKTELAGRKSRDEAAAQEVDDLKKKIKEFEALLRDSSRLRQEASDLRATLLTTNDHNTRLTQRTKDLETARDRADRSAEEAVRRVASLMELQEGFDAQRRTLEERNAQAAQRAQQLRVVEEQCAKTVKKVLAAEEASESGYSCQLCFNLFKNPVIVGPCGHCYCLDCFDSNSRRNPPPPTKPGKEPVLHCAECDRFVVTSVIECNSLSILSGKFEYRKQQLSDLSLLLEKELGKSRRASMTPPAE